MTPQEQSALAVRRVAGWTAVPIAGTVAIVCGFWHLEDTVHWNDNAMSLVMGSLFSSAAWSGLWVGAIALYKHALEQVRKEEFNKEKVTWK